MRIAMPVPRRRPEPILPMVNLVFLLLIFFLMVATLAPPPPTPVDPARGTGTPPETVIERRLALDAQGRIHFDGRTGPAALEAARAAGAGPVALHADRAAPAAALAGILAALAPAEVALVVDPAP